jgi:hypothetical protein
MADTAALVVALSAQLTQFERDMRKAAGIAQRGAKQVEDAWTRTNPFQVLGGKTLAGLAAGIGLQQIIDKSIDAVKALEAIGDVAERIDITTDSLQALQFVVSQNGGSAEDAVNALTKFSDTIGDAANSSTYFGTVLEANGVSLRDANKEIRSTDELLVDFARIVQGAGSQAERMSLVTEAFGRRAGPQMLVALQEIARVGLPAVIKGAKDAGQIVEQELIENAQRFADAWDAATNRAIKGLQSFVIKSIDAIKKFDEKISETKENLQALGEAPGTMDFALPPELQEPGQGRRPPGTTPFVPPAENIPLPPRRPPNLPRTIIPPKSTAEDPFERQIKSIEKHIAVMNADTEAVGLSAGAQERLRITATLTQELLSQDKSPELYAQRIAEIGAAAEEAANRLAAKQFAFHEAISASQDLGSALSQAFQGAALEGRKLDEVLQNLVARLASRSIDKLFDMVFAPGAGGGNTLFNELIKSLSGRQSGGPVRRNQPYMVGEKGPELFVPNQSGMVVPSQVTQSGGAVASGERNLNISVDVTGANGDAAIEAAVNRGVARAVQQSVSIVNSTAPGRQLRFSQLGT